MCSVSFFMVSPNCGDGSAGGGGGDGGGGGVTSVRRYALTLQSSASCSDFPLVRGDFKVDPLNHRAGAVTESKDLAWILPRSFTPRHNAREEQALRRGGY